jgi:hypothetical protein
MKLYLVFFIFVNMLPSLVKAQSLSEVEIQELITGNTLTGRSTEGRFFSEYHLPDGKVLGNNGYYQNTDACWIVKQNQICYYYGEGANRGLHCFALEKSNDVISMKFVPPNPQAGTLDAFAKIEKGNPRNHTDGGKSWHCDGLVSDLSSSKIILAQAMIPTENKAQHDFQFLTGESEIKKQSLSKTPQKMPLGAIPRIDNKELRTHSFISDVAPPNSSKLPPGQIPQPADKIKVDPKLNQKPSLAVTPLPRGQLPKMQIKQPSSQPSQHRSVKNFHHPQPQFRTIPRSSPTQTAKPLLPQNKFCPTGKSGC